MSPVTQESEPSSDIFAEPHSRLMCPGAGGVFGGGSDERVVDGGEELFEATQGRLGEPG